jgi:hypothetical protein
MVVVRLCKTGSLFVALSIVVIGGLSLINELWRDPVIALATVWFWQGDEMSAGLRAWLIYFTPYLRVTDFIAGMLMAQAYRMSDTDWMSSWLLPCALLWTAIVGMTLWLFPWEPLETRAELSRYSGGCTDHAACERAKELAQAHPVIHADELSRRDQLFDPISGRFSS